jgi:hypothetical protein
MKNSISSFSAAAMVAVIELVAFQQKSWFQGRRAMALRPAIPTSEFSLEDVAAGTVGNGVGVLSY